MTSNALPRGQESSIPPSQDSNRCRINVPSNTMDDTCSFLKLPTEIRECIYEFLYSSYTIRHGFTHASLPKTPGAALESSTRTALLLTCRQIHSEAWRHLPLNALFYFRGTENCLDTLLSADQSVITRIRHMRMKAYPFPLFASGRPDYYPTYYAAHAFELLPGLSLDTLVVEDCWHGFGLGDTWRDVTTYFDFEALLHSAGWKELTFITCCTDFIASGYDHRRKRVAQPDNWDAIIKERDGEDSGAEVHMMIVPFKQELATGHLQTEDGLTMQPWSAIPGNEVIEDGAVGRPDQKLKGEVRIIARRGKRATTVQLGLSQNLTWRKLKRLDGGLTNQGTWSSISVIKHRLIPRQNGRRTTTTCPT